MDVWHNYVALVDVAHENARLREALKQSRAKTVLSAEERAELIRLRTLLRIDALRETPGFGARVIAMRFGPQAVLKSLTINKGFVDGAVVGAPVIASAGVVGRVLRTAPHAATVLLLTDPLFRLAVISQDSRTPGIITGGTTASGSALEVAYVAQNARIAEGELLITSGVDGQFPKGIPVGMVTSVEPGNETLFLQVHARPLVTIEHLEEVVLLQDGGGVPFPAAPEPGYTSVPSPPPRGSGPGDETRP